jgi:LytS/YehU family sensor histidine kinase
LTNEKQKNFLIIISLLFVSILFTVFVLFNRYKIKKQNESLKSKLEEAEKTILAEKKASLSELKAFKSQMNPHFFYNALNTIQSYILSNDKKLAISYLSKFSLLTRSILEMTEKESISVSEEIKTLALYLDIEKARFNEDFIYNITTANSEHLDMIQIPTLFLQPYVENAVKHGLLHKEGTKKLDIQFEIQSELLRITIDDNGIGRQKSAALNTIKNKHHTSFATNAMEHRIEILNKTKTNKITVQFVDKVNTAHQYIGTTVLIKIPLD